MKNNRTSPKTDITFFVPCLNEEDNIILSLETMISAVKKTKYTYEVLIFDDHSKDNTVNKIRDYQKRHKDLPIKLIINDKTMGIGFNYFKGAYLGRGRYYLIICGDNDMTEEFIIKVLNKLGSADMIIPYITKHDKRLLIRRITSHLYTFIVNLISGHSIKYYNGCAAHLRKNITGSIRKPSGFGFQAELITNLLGRGKSYIELSQTPIIQKNNKIFTSAFNIKSVIPVLNSLLNILFLRFRKNR